MAYPFDEVLFPTNIPYGFRGGPQRQTNVVVLGSGERAANARWQDSLRSYTVGYGMKDLNLLSIVSEFWEARNAQLRGFRFLDPLDDRSCRPLNNPTPFDCRIGTGDGVTTVFPLVKPYTNGGQTWLRPIKKPTNDPVAYGVGQEASRMIRGPVRIGVSGIEVAGWTVNTTNGNVTFGVAPLNLAPITAGFFMHVPSVFAVDRLEINLDDFRAGKFTGFPIEELPL